MDKIFDRLTRNIGNDAKILFRRLRDKFQFFVQIQMRMAER